MNYSYGTGKKVYGKNLQEARYNALLETYYLNYSETANNAKSGKNYYASDAETGQLLERRILNDDVYLPDEDEQVLADLVQAYKSTKYDNTQSCRAQKDEASCNSLKFRGAGRCVYEKKWLSFIRGGTCVVDEKLVEHLVNNLQPFVKIRWDSLKASPLTNPDPNLPNPDNFSKEDIADLIHDLGHHMKQLFTDGDLTSVIAKNTGHNILQLSEQELLYYLYLFSYIIYASSFLTETDFLIMFTDKNFKKLTSMLSQKSAGKNALINFIVEFNASVPKKQRTKATAGWKYPAIVGPTIILLFFSFLPSASASTLLERHMEVGKFTEEVFPNHLAYITVGFLALWFLVCIVRSISRGSYNLYSSYTQKAKEDEKFEANKLESADLRRSTRNRK